ncbi:TPA: hypothetical protein H1005_00160 [archaeon]|nr:hypothetical protein [Candidatus Naiadarchaeales archaeon SRR2090153.bin1042]
MMVKKNVQSIILSFFVIAFSVLFSLIFSSNLVSSQTVDCFRYIGNYTGCIAVNSSCFWGNNSGVVPNDPFCMINYGNYNSTNLTMFAPWLGISVNYNTLTGGNIINSGCCMMKMGGGSGGGQSCFSFEGNQTGCMTANTTLGIQGCSWVPNDANQNPFCPNNVGCCEKQGCWSFRGNQASCVNNTGGVCFYDTSCPSGDCCAPKACSEMDTETKCNNMNQYDMPCQWSGGACTMPGGGFSVYNNNTNGCLAGGGWINASNSCVMPSSSGGGGFMFAQEARCWFADNKQSICLNVTGCVYCSNTTTQINNASSACYNAPSGACKGHESMFSNWNGTASINVIDINTSSLLCSNIRQKQTCNCGPMPNCKWGNSSASVGNYCEVGMKTNDEMQTCQPPVQFCEDNAAKNNQTLCNLLASDYMMPCKFDSSGGNNCTFNSMAIFGSNSGSSGSMNYNIISNEIGCIASGGTWKTENYIDSDGGFKSDSWCEKGMMFSFSSGQAFANKGSCDSDCWACGFNSTGGNWPNAANASAACLGSKKGICKFKTDLNAPNGLGWCDYPQEMSFGGVSDCKSDCKACEYMGMTSAESQQACSASPVGCSWVNESNAPNGKGGFCMSSSMKSCTNDCFACYEQSKCSNSTFHTAMNCSWDSSFNYCKPQGFTGEICFNAVDDDNDGMKDCADSDCTYDQFCGGGSIGSGNSITDCKKKSDSTTCRATQTASNTNCTWVTSQFGGQSYCDYPGSNCWMYESNITACAGGIGCIYRNATAGYPNTNISILVNFKSFNGFCDMNKTKSNICFNSTNMGNQVLCNNASECSWLTDSYNPNGGRCEFKPFAICGNNTNSVSCGSVSSFCSWRNDSFSLSGGFCEPKCMGLAQGSCNGFCSWKATSCEPEAFGGMGGGGSGAGGIGGGFGCHINDGNQTGCISQNMTCSWNAFSQNASQGVCNQKGEQMMMEGMDQSPPKILGQDPNDTSVGEIDIREYGVKDSDKSLSFGIVVTNITNAAVCRGYYLGGGFGGMGGGQGQIGNGSSTTKYYWYLDTNKNVSDGCNAVKSDGSNVSGFEFLMKYMVSLDNLTVSEVKSFYKCSGGSWSLTNVPLTSNRQFMCGMSFPSFPGQAPKIGGVMIVVNKENLQSFDVFNKSVPTRVFVSSANATFSESNPQDSVNTPGYYTPGSADFKFVDCSNPSTKDAKCKNFQQFGFNIFEDCKNGKDDDNDGMSDCSDPKCKFTPNCASGTAFNFIADANDVQAPTVSFSQVDVLRDSSFIKFDTNEPANGTVEFYYNDSSCGSVNVTKIDLGDPSISFDDYKPFHLVALELNTLGYSLTNGTTYFYKTSVCDPSSNCAISACQNFTTSSEAYKNFIFKMKLPAGYNVTIPALNYSGNFTTSISGTTYETGIKTNASVSRNLNITVNCGTQSLTFVGADILSPKSIDMRNAFVCNPSSNILGMNSTSKSWNQLIGDIGMGGQSDNIKLTFPVDYSSENTIKWCNDDGSTNCTLVTSYASCSSGGTSKTDCKIPTSLGFSTYKVETTAAAVAASPGGSSGGGGGGDTGFWKNTYAYDTKNFSEKEPLTRELLKGYRVRIKLGNETHYVGVISLTSTSVTINVSSTPQQATLNVGESKKFEISGDDFYDILVKLNSINNNKTSMTISYLHEQISQTPPADVNTPAPSSPGTGEANTPTGNEGGARTTEGIGVGKIVAWIFGIVAIIILLIAVIVLVKKKRKWK